MTTRNTKRPAKALVEKVKKLLKRRKGKGKKNGA